MRIRCHFDCGWRGGGVPGWSRGEDISPFPIEAEIILGGGTIKPGWTTSVSRQMLHRSVRREGTSDACPCMLSGADGLKMGSSCAGFAPSLLTEKGFETRGSFTVRKSRAGESFYLRVYGA